MRIALMKMAMLVRIDMNEQWREQAQGRSISVGVWSHGCSIRIHRLGSYGVVYNYSFPENEGGYASLCILQIENLRWIIMQDSAESEFDSGVREWNFANSF